MEVGDEYYEKYMCHDYVDPWSSDEEIPFYLFEDEYPELFEEKFIQKHLGTIESYEEQDTTHIGLVFFFRESGCPTCKEKEDFSHWFGMEVLRLTKIKPAKRVEENKVIFVLRIRKFQKDWYYNIKSDILDIVQTERFFSHVAYAYLLTENVYGEDLYESCVTSEAWTIDSVKFSLAKDHDKGHGADFSPTDEVQMREFWERYPVYAGDARQYYIHLGLNEYRRLREEQKNHMGNKRKTKRRRHNRKN